MSRLILAMAMSLDGFITGPGDDKQNPAGVGGMRLQAWLGDGGPKVADWRPSDRQSQIVFDELMSTGAVITGRRTGDFADYWGGDHHDGVPIFVPTHTAPADHRHERVHFVTDGIAACVEQAKAAAGERDVLLHGAYTAQECLKAGVLDVLEIQLLPVLLGQGRLCSRACRPSTPSSNWSGRWRHRRCFISATRCDAHDRIDDRRSASTCRCHVRQGVATFAGLLPLLPLVYLVVAKLRRRQTTAC